MNFKTRITRLEERIVAEHDAKHNSEFHELLQIATDDEMLEMYDIFGRAFGPLRDLGNQPKPWIDQSTATDRRRYKEIMESLVERLGVPKSVWNDKIRWPGVQHH